MYLVYEKLLCYIYKVSNKIYILHKEVAAEIGLCRFGKKYYLFKWFTLSRFKKIYRWQILGEAGYISIVERTDSFNVLFLTETIFRFILMEAYTGTKALLGDNHFAVGNWLQQRPSVVHFKLCVCRTKTTIHNYATFLQKVKH